MKNIVVVFVSLITLLSFIFICSRVNAYGTYGDCSGYGLMAYYDVVSGYCKCMSGYIFDQGILGDTQCVSAFSYCMNKYGYGATYGYLSDSCECSSGYVMSGSRCISGNTYCTNEYGYGSRYNSLSDKCECNSGYEFTLKAGGGLECKSCILKYGYHSSYDYLSKQCECDDNYTLKDGQCVEKQNNVYFLLKEVDTDTKQAIIKSDYDYQSYLIKYGIGCYSNSIKRYLDQKIVVNLGTDFDVDTWDKVVLYDDNETCDITYVRQVGSSYSLNIDETNSGSYIVNTNQNITNDVTSKLIKVAGRPAVYWFVDGKKYLFANRDVFHSWFVDDFSGLQEIEQSYFDSIELGGNITVKSGNYIKFDNSNNIYLVKDGSNICKIKNYTGKPYIIQSGFQANYTDLGDCI